MKHCSSAILVIAIALWGLTTEPTIAIEPKHFPAYKAPNFLNHIITTNDQARR